MLRKIYYSPIVPGSFVYRVLFFLARGAFNLGVIKANKSIHYIETKGVVVVLTPLAGSSSIRSVAGNVKTLNLLSGIAVSATEIYVLDRSFGKRMQSFYNKKVRNPTNMGKIILLASCSPLHHKTTPEEFNQYLIQKQHTLDKDKHLYTTDQVIAALSKEGEVIRKISLAEDTEFLQQLLGIDLSRQAKTTEEIATYAAPVEFQLDTSLRSTTNE